MNVSALVDRRGILALRRITRHVRFVLPVACVVLLSSVQQRPAEIPMPGLVLWAWERPEDLRFIDPASTGVAYLAATANVQLDGTARFHFRQQPLLAPKGTRLIAMVRIESPSRYVFGDARLLACDIAGIADQQNVTALQIDYDARASERGFYGSLLAELRRNTRLPVGITALASWCSGDPWINGQGVNGQTVAEAVPMFFRMGRNESKNMNINAAVCGDAIGLSTDEAWPASRPTGLHSGARIYVFNPHSWTESEYEDVVRRVEEWR